LKPLNCSNDASEAEERPLPRDETTPPVTNIYRAMEEDYNGFKKKIKVKLLI